MTTKLSRNDYNSCQFDKLARMHWESIAFQTNKYASLWGVIGIAWMQHF